MLIKEWECPNCGLKLNNVLLPVHCSCEHVGGRKSETPIKKLDLSDCIYQGPATHQTVHCGCPSSGREMIYWCYLHQCVCTRSPISKRFNINQRSCVQCYGLDEGYTKKP